jgi:hypothetical protein
LEKIVAVPSGWITGQFLKIVDFRSEEYTSPLENKGWKYINP